MKVSFDVTSLPVTFAGGVDMLDAYQWGDVYWQVYKNTYGTHPNSVVYGNGKKPSCRNIILTERSQNKNWVLTDWGKGDIRYYLMQNYNLFSKGFKDIN